MAKRKRTKNDQQIKSGGFKLVFLDPNLLSKLDIYVFIIRDFFNYLSSRSFEVLGVPDEDHPRN
jgi:hypothetical protein